MRVTNFPLMFLVCYCFFHNRHHKILHRHIIQKHNIKTMSNSPGIVKYVLNGLEIEVDTETGYMLENNEVFRRNYERMLRQQLGVLSEPGEELQQLPDHSPLSSQSVADKLEDKMWTSDNTLFLISMVQRFEKEFSCGIKKNVWSKVAELCKDTNKYISAKQCESKWKSITRTYKGILNHNNTSGQKRRYNILFKKPEISAVATCSSLTGLHVNDEAREASTSGLVENVNSHCDAPTSTPTTSRPDNNKENSEFESSFSKKRKLRATEQERRHKEKMKRLDRFNDLFEKMVSKMPEPKINNF